MTPEDTALADRLEELSLRPLRLPSWVSHGDIAHAARRLRELGAEVERLTKLYEGAVSNRDFYADERKRERAVFEARISELEAERRTA